MGNRVCHAIFLGNETGKSPADAVLIPAVLPSISEIQYLVAPGLGGDTSQNGPEKVKYAKKWPMQVQRAKGLAKAPVWPEQGRSGQGTVNTSRKRDSVGSEGLKRAAAGQSSWKGADMGRKMSKQRVAKPMVGGRPVWGQRVTQQPKETARTTKMPFTHGLDHDQ